MSHKQLTRKRPALNFFPPAECQVLPNSRLHLVFARDDAAGSDKRPAGPARILVVEDDFLVASQIEGALTDAGFEVAAVLASAEAAIEEAATDAVSLAVMDIRLAGNLDGVDGAIALFKKHGIRCIFATAHCDSDARMRAQPAKPLGWLQKPYSMASLVAVIRAALNSLEKKN